MQCICLSQDGAFAHLLIAAPWENIPPVIRNVRRTDYLAVLIDRVNRPGEAPLPERIGAMGKSVKYAPEVRERAVRMLKEHEHEYPSRWAAIESIAGNIGCTAQTLRT
jgi:hypothetical protein